MWETFGDSSRTPAIHAMSASWGFQLENCREFVWVRIATLSRDIEQTVYTHIFFIWEIWPKRKRRQVEKWFLLCAVEIVWTNEKFKNLKNCENWKSVKKTKRTVSFIVWSRWIELHFLFAFRFRRCIAFRSNLFIIFLVFPTKVRIHDEIQFSIFDVNRRKGEIWFFVKMAKYK